MNVEMCFYGAILCTCRDMKIRAPSKPSLFVPSNPYVAMHYCEWVSYRCFASIVSNLNHPEAPKRKSQAFTTPS